MIAHEREDRLTDLNDETTERDVAPLRYMSKCLNSRVFSGTYQANLIWIFSGRSCETATATLYQEGDDILCQESAHACYQGI